MGLSVTEKIIAAHSAEGIKKSGEPIALKIDQTLTQDATGTMAWLQFEALGLKRVNTELSVSYVDHNTLQMGFRNADDHRFLRTTAEKFGAIFSPAGTGICHQLHLENFARPGATLLGSDSHTPTAGGIGCLAMGAGGLSVALAMGGQSYTIPMPKIVRVLLLGSLQNWASAKDIILHLLGKISVKGGVGKIFEYAGPGLNSLSVPERATITNMGAELGATTSIFPSDEKTLAFMKAQGREKDWVELTADEGATYDEEISINLDELVPLVACPHMPDKVVPVASLAGLKVDQVAIGSCTNSSFTDMMQVAHLFSGKKIAANIDLSVNPGSKQVLLMLSENGGFASILNAGGRVLESACGACIGMGNSPVSSGVSVRTFNRNFEGRSGTKDAQVYLVSPFTAAQVALHGCFTDPKDWGAAPKNIPLPTHFPSIRDLFIYPPENGEHVEILRGPNIAALERFTALESSLSLEAVLKVGDNISTDHIMPAGAEITALRSNLPAIAEHTFERVDASFAERAKKVACGLILAGENYGQGSSREHAALAPRYLHVQAVLALSFARIHRANLINCGILPLVFANKNDYAKLELGDTFTLDVRSMQAGESSLLFKNTNESIVVVNDLSSEELEIIKQGGLLNYSKNKLMQ